MKEVFQVVGYVLGFADCFVGMILRAGGFAGLLFFGSVLALSMIVGRYMDCAIFGWLLLSWVAFWGGGVGVKETAILVTGFQKAIAESKE